MNLEATAKQLQALFEETNKAVKGNWIAPETDEIVKILRDNLSGGGNNDPRCALGREEKQLNSAVSSSSPAQSQRCPTCNEDLTGWISSSPAQSSQPKPESWVEMELWTRSGREVVRQGCVIFTCDDEVDAVHAVELHNPTVERSHAADAFRCRKCGAALGWCEPDVCDKCQKAAQPQPSKASPPQQPNLPCGCTIKQGDSMNSSVFWNEFNRVVQCHKCGQVYEPASQLGERSEHPLCEICGEPMPKGEEMFKYHGHSGPCPKPPLSERSEQLINEEGIKRFQQNASDQPSGSGRTTDDKQLHELVMDLRVACGDPVNLHRRLFDILKPKFDALNAALATERHRREQAERNLEHTEGMWEQLKKHRDELHEQLLSALAAIEHVRKREGCIVTDERLAQIIDNVELSALREHDAELWKLLIDGRNRAICQKCGYPELIGSDDCRNCRTNFNKRIEFGEKHDAEVRKPLESKIKELQDEIDRLNAR